MSGQTVALAVVGLVALVAVGAAVYLATRPPVVQPRPTTAGTIIGGVVDAIF